MVGPLQCSILWLNAAVKRIRWLNAAAPADKCSAHWTCRQNGWTDIWRISIKIDNMSAIYIRFIKNSPKFELRGQATIWLNTIGCRIKRSLGIVDHRVHKACTLARAVFYPVLGSKLTKREREREKTKAKLGIYKSYIRPADVSLIIKGRTSSSRYCLQLLMSSRTIPATDEQEISQQRRTYNSAQTLVIFMD